MATSLVQGPAKAQSSGASINVTMGSNPTNGNVLVAVVSIGRATLNTVTSITQTNVAWSYVTSKSNVGTYTLNVEIWVGVVSASAGTGVTVNLSGSNNNAIADVCEWSGDYSTVDVTASNSGTSAVTDTGTTAATSVADELWIGGVCSIYGPGGSPTNGFTLLDSAGDAYVSNSFLYKIVSATGTANTGHNQGGTNEWVGCIATFNAGGGAAVPIGAISMHQTGHIISKITRG